MKTATTPEPANPARCVMQTTRGHRCRRRAVAADLCQQHYDQAKKEHRSFLEETEAARRRGQRWTPARWIHTGEPVLVRLRMM